MLDFGAVSRDFLERKLGRVTRFWDPAMTCFAAFRTPGGGWNAEFGSLAQCYPALTALFTLLDEASRVGGGSPQAGRGVIKKCSSNSPGKGALAPLRVEFWW